MGHFILRKSIPCRPVLHEVSELQNNKWWNTLDQQGLSDPMSLAGAKEYFKKAESNLECRTDALLNKKQKKSNNSLLSAVRSWNVSF